MKIGELAKAAGTQVETIRFYDRQGLMPVAGRPAGKHRAYENADFDRLVFIQQCRGLGMGLDDIRTLLRFRESPGDDCVGVGKLLERHINRLATRFRELQTLEVELCRLQDYCRVDPEQKHAPSSGPT